MFYVGQRVCCVDARPNQGWTVSWLVPGQVYTVTNVARATDAGGLFKGPLVSVELAEVAGKPTGFNAARFRPVVERKTSIEIFKAMLNPSDKRVSA